MADSGRYVKIKHWMRWKIEEGGFREAYASCGVPMTQDIEGYGVYTDNVTCEECKLWLLVNQMAK